MTIVRTYTIKYEITNAMDFGRGNTISSIREARSGLLKGEKDTLLEKCFACKKKFEDDDIPFLGFVKGHKNVCLCRDCGAKVLAEIKA